MTSSFIDEHLDRVLPGLRARVEAALAKVDEQEYHAATVAASHGALLLMGTIGSVWGLCPEGRFIEIKGMDMEGPVVSLARELRLSALVYGVTRHAWLAEALPEAAEDARICLGCQGQRFLGPSGPQPDDGGAMVCPWCSGLGFLDVASGGVMDAPGDPPFIDGHISDYNEQGMEASYHLVFQPRDAPRDPGEMRILRAGDQLCVWDERGGVLWHGRLDTRRRILRRDWGPQHPLWSPPGVLASRWLEWFRRRPNLRAFWRPAGDDDR